MTLQPDSRAPFSGNFHVKLLTLSFKCAECIIQLLLIDSNQIANKPNKMSVLRPTGTRTNVKKPQLVSQIQQFKIQCHKFHASNEWVSEKTVLKVLLSSFKKNMDVALF